MRPSHFLLPGLTVLSLVGFSPSALADGRKPGSLLIFPEFDNRVANVTMFTVTNTNSSFTPTGAAGVFAGTIDVHFYYIGRVATDGSLLDCVPSNFTARLSPTDTFTFLTRSHNPNQSQGFMYCYAQHPLTGEPIDFDFLIGNALFLNGTVAIDYSTNPISLEGKTPPGTTTNIDAPPDGNRDLDGLEYEQMPDQILIPRFLASTGALRSELVMLGLSGGAAFTTQFSFTIWGDDEDQFSAFRSVRCWERVPLDVIDSVFLQSFMGAHGGQNPLEPLGATTRESGWMRIDSLLATSGAAENISNPAIYAVLVERVARGAGAADLPFEIGWTDTGSLFPSGPNGDGPGGNGR